MSDVISPRGYLEQTDWAKVRDDVQRLNPVLTQYIDAWSPGPEFVIYKIRYPFGSQILKKGYLQIPDESGQLVPLYSDSILSNIRDNLNYNYGSNPATFVLKGSTEIFIELDGRLIPLYSLILPGRLVGTWRVLSNAISHNPTFLWGMTAGARSLLMLPKISDYNSHQRIKQKFGIRADTPQSALEHWQIFKELSDAFYNKSPWEVELLFFAKNWFEPQQSQAWQNFKSYLLQLAFDGSEFWRNQFIWNLIFSMIQERQNIRPDSYSIALLKHIIAMGAGVAPGFAPALDDTAGPIQLLQTIYQEVYQLKYAPIIMQPYTFSLHNRPVYYSLQYPTTTEFSRKSAKAMTKIMDLSQLQFYLEKIFNEIATGHLNLEHTPFYDLVENVNFDFFHSEKESLSKVRNSRDIPLEDEAFLKLFPQGLFPENCPFVRGCLRISKK